ncbi:hypothetical protein TW80_05605 [Loktanella sp. S4079]|nr:hypothetical protein TW80_05605 [Loktanella sp. S4079]
MIKRIFGILVVVATMAACSMTGSGTEPRLAMDRSYDLRGLNFSTKDGITVSEENRYYPTADIVWRGDEPGPRVQQIEAMFQTAAQRNESVLRGQRPIVVDVQLQRFHGVTEQTRATIGGVYNIIFLMTVRDARTGEVIEPARRIEADLRAPGGRQAIEMDRNGRTQKVEVTDFLTATLRNQLL